MFKAVVTLLVFLWVTPEGDEPNLSRQRLAQTAGCTGDGNFQMPPCMPFTPRHLDKVSGIYYTSTQRYMGIFNGQFSDLSSSE